MNYKTPGEKIFDVFNIIFMAVMIVVFIYPFMDLLSLSLAHPVSANQLKIRFFPEFPLSFTAYISVFQSKYLLTAFGNTLFRTIAGSGLTLVFTFSGAFVLAKRTVPLRNFFTTMLLITMLFGGGLIPSYLNMRNLGLIGSRLAWILPGLTSAWNIFIMRNFIMTIQPSMEEAAIMDGAGVYTTMFRIIFPLCMPIIAVILLWSAVGHWNAYFDAMIYTPANNMVVLQTLLRRILIENSRDTLGAVMVQETTTSTPETVKAATIMITIIPILCVYPFLQKYFVKGIHIGAIKG